MSSRRDDSPVFDRHPFLVVEGIQGDAVTTFVARYGGQVVRQIGAAPTDQRRVAALVEWAQRTLCAEIDATLLMTGNGVQRLFSALKPRFDLQRLAHALHDGRTLAASAWAAAALRERGIDCTEVPFERSQWKSLLTYCEAEIALANCTVAIEQTIHHVELSAGLEARGARVVDMPIWGPPLRRALGDAGNQADREPWPTTVVVFDEDQLGALADYVRSHPAVAVEDLLVLALDESLGESAELIGFRVRRAVLPPDASVWSDEEAQTIARFMW